MDGERNRQIFNLRAWVSAESEKLSLKKQKQKPPKHGEVGTIVPPLPARDTLQNPQWMAEKADSNKPYIYYVLSYTHKFMINFNKLGTVRD